MKGIHRITKEVLASLSPKQREVLELRYGLFGATPATLNQIGKKMGRTRERIRQIENSALNSLKAKRAHEVFSPLIDPVRVHLASLGGVRRETMFFDEALHLIGEGRASRPMAIRALEFVFSLASAPVRMSEDSHYHSAWYATKDDLVKAKNFTATLEKATKRHGAPMNADDFIKTFKLAMAQSGITNDVVAAYYVGISKKFKFNAYGDFGLSIWPQIEPRGMREKAYLVTKKAGAPMHFSQISDAINAMRFDSKLAQPQTVHNELIKDKRFVLCGRGTYGLREWGIEPGTVKDVLSRILKSKGPLYSDELVRLVKTERQVKDSTILLGLQNKSSFHQLDDGRYKIKTA